MFLHKYHHSILLNIQKSKFHNVHITHQASKHVRIISNNYMSSSYLLTHQASKHVKIITNNDMSSSYFLIVRNQEEICKKTQVFFTFFTFSL